MDIKTKKRFLRWLYRRGPVMRPGTNPKPTPVSATNPCREPPGKTYLPGLKLQNSHRDENSYQQGGGDDEIPVNLAELRQRQGTNSISLSGSQSQRAR